MTYQPRDRAVVLGGSMSGLVAAHVLAETYGEVVVVERDKLPAAPQNRRGVPQGRHVHALLPRGREALEELFPGLTTDLVSRGVPMGDLLADTRVFLNGHRFQSAPSGLTTLFVSRPRLEAYIRSRAASQPRVQVLDGCDAVGIASTSDASRVTGVRVISRVDGSAEETLPADLVVDATGRGSRTPLWLEALGYAAPRSEQVRIGVGYASCRYRLPAGTLGGVLSVLNAPTPEHPRGGAFSAMEDDEWIVTLLGVLGDHPPTDPPGFVDFAATLQFPDIHELLVAGRPLDEPVAFRHPTSVRHHYEKLSRLPEGLLVLGDALCSFNPIYGQGLTVAALQALTLRRHLRGGVKPLRFFHDVAGIVGVAWDMAIGGDLSYPQVEGKRTARTRLVNRYIGRLHAGAAVDPELGRAFLRVSGLVAPPQALVAPSVLRRVLANDGRRSFAARRGSRFVHS